MLGVKIYQALAFLFQLLVLIQITALRLVTIASELPSVAFYLTNCSVWHNCISSRPTMKDNESKSNYGQKSEVWQQLTGT